MNPIRSLLTVHHARTDAARQTTTKETYTTETLGLPPLELERGSHLYRDAVRQAADTGRLEELREDHRRGEDLLPIVGDPWPYTLGLAAVWGLEVAGSLLILRALGVPAEHRPLPALALTLAMVGLTKLTVAATATPRTLPPAAAPASPDPDSSSSAPAAGRAPIPWKRYLLPLVYGVLVAGVAVTRVVGSDATDVPPIVAAAEAVIMIAITCGPAFAATWLESKRAPAKELARRIALIQKRLRAEERRIKRAQKFLAKVDRDQVRWTQDNAVLRATFTTAYTRAVAENRADADLDADSTQDLATSTER